MDTSVRYPAVAESFYPSDGKELELLVMRLLEEANPRLPHTDGTIRIRGILAPHASYAFSGNVAATAFKPLQGQSYSTVFIIGNAHAYLFKGVALDGHEAWASPLGTVALNGKCADKLRSSAPRIIRNLTIAHHSEHVLEVHLPFLQSVLQQGFTILPLLFGECGRDTKAKVVDMIIDAISDDDLLIASSDLSHYPAYHDAATIDRETLDYITELDITGLKAHEKSTMRKKIPHEDALFCGPDSLEVLMKAAVKHGWKAAPLLYSNSGDATWQDREAVVGYGAVIFYSVSQT
ncbi:MULTISPECIES: AmmeMemoRadiSam system protein B [Prosthecochloris]|uniref:AmmeMemoRadiSam system protein B n=1 Tax=Prosthecochloris vibrioformis TaxID=1098 RepID=A0A5C4RYY1_PROVB|nr:MULTISPECIES: AmmeMemoRadiSam system protein B [Prosthecochloris]ANT64056.1 Memo-like protein [Prosthecochloris sp. CIB 2401]TNJ36340.1 AmmeMemoRadiSam system protein B [Prosthecochloris vibrioformis]